MNKGFEQNINNDKNLDSIQIELPEKIETDLKVLSENKSKTYNMRAIAILCVLLSSAGIAVFKPNTVSNLISGEGDKTAISRALNTSKTLVSEKNKTQHKAAKSLAISDESTNSKNILYSGVSLAPLVMERLPIRDTIYTTGNEYLDVNLSNQTVTVINRDGTKNKFLISSGTPYISGGMATPSGIFTVQNKTPMALSKQFHNAKLHFWIGVQGGVGFHGLDGSGYYWNLGKRPSSHGCIRMARNEIKEMYSLVHEGSIIKVHNGEPARVVAFCDKSDTMNAILIDSASVYNRKLGLDRYNMLMKGEYWTNPIPRIVHKSPQRVRWGMPIGKAVEIPAQKLPDNLRIYNKLSSKSSIVWLDNLFVNKKSIISKLPKPKIIIGAQDDDSIPEVIQP